MRNYSRNPREWMAFFGWWLVFMIIWVIGLVALGSTAKIMWRVFMFGWELV